MLSYGVSKSITSYVLLIMSMMSSIRNTNYSFFEYSLPPFPVIFLKLFIFEKKKNFFSPKKKLFSPNLPKSLKETPEHDDL